jgi:uncharacterized protein YciI
MKMSILRVECPIVQIVIIMKYFFYKLIAPRPTFIRDISAEEAKLMGEHAAYWKALMDKGLVVAFGPVADPNQSYGIGILEVDEDVDVAAFGLDDPAIKADVGFKFEVHPMPRVILRK